MAVIEAKMTKAICTGSASTEDRALEWLRQHGAIIDGCQAVTVIVLPEKALVEKNGYEWRYSISFYGPDGNPEGQYVEVESYIDAYDTVLRLMEV